MSVKSQSSNALHVEIHEVPAVNSTADEVDAEGSEVLVHFASPSVHLLRI